MSNKSHAHSGGESSDGIVPAKQPNEGQGGPQEVAEGRPSAKENTEQSNLCRTPSRESGLNGLERVREAAVRFDANIQGKNRVR